MLKKNWVLAITLVGLAIALMAEPALAEDGATVMRRMENQTAAGASLAQVIFRFVGIVVCGHGLYGFYMNSKKDGQDPKYSIRASLAAVIIGGMLYSLSAVMNTSAESTLGSTSRTTLQIR